MNLKEIIIEELVFGFKQNKPKWWDYETYLRFIEPIIRGAVNSATGNITTTDWQVIASGVVGRNEDSISLFVKESEGCSFDSKDIFIRIYKKFKGKDIEIAVRVKEGK